MGESVIISGVRYVPDPLHVDGVKFYFMHDNHTFTRLNGATLDEVLDHADAVEAGEWGNYGMLCPAILLHGEKEVRRVGPAAHARGSKDPKDHWNAGKVKWREAMEADIDVMRLMPSNNELSIKPLQTSVVSYGAGTNSTAMLIGLHERGECPDLILFADTGGERPETYAHRDAVSDWCESVGFPRIVTVRKEGNMETLEENCLRMNMLPSIAYGFKSCSGKYKIQPQEKWANNNAECKAVWKSGGKILKMIGYDADEHHRAKIPEDKKYTYRYPLVEWDWGRAECVDAIARAGLSQPGKSACFFCPSSKPREIMELGRTHPDLLARALAMEARAELTSVKGLGRSFAWADLVKYSEAQLDLFSHTPEIPCGCFDG